MQVIVTPESFAGCRCGFARCIPIDDLLAVEGADRRLLVFQHAELEVVRCLLQREKSSPKPHRINRDQRSLLQIVCQLLSRRKVHVDENFHALFNSTSRSSERRAA
ncbi:MAG TPA: hypothetical protein VKV05_03120 [Terriglobales bacterium]|nr:hypothetical protein [Terriglobales bacterium]